MELTISGGKGYVPAHLNKSEDAPIGLIAIDAIYSPVRKVMYRVDNARVGQQTDYDRLNLEVWTDGSIAPEDAVRSAAKILLTHLELLAGAPVEEPEEPEEPEEGIPSRIYEAPIEELELTVRAYNCLKRAGITKIGEILRRMEKGEDEMLAIRNFGKKSLDELVDRLRDKNYLTVPGVDPSAYLEDSEREDGDEPADESENDELDELLNAEA